MFEMKACIYRQVNKLSLLPLFLNYNTHEKYAYHDLSLDIFIFPEFIWCLNTQYQKYFLLLF